MIQKTIVAADLDNDIAIVITVEIPDENFDVMGAIQAASVDYVNTPEGKEVLNDNGGYFNWGDVVNNLPDDICKRYGFEIVNVIDADNVVHHDDCMATEEDVFDYAE